MARWSPTTPLYEGPTLGDILARGVRDWRARSEAERERQRQEELDRKAEERDELALALRGVHRGTAPREDLAIYAPALPEPPSLEDELQRGALGVGGPNEVAGSIFDRPIGSAGAMGQRGAGLGLGYQSGPMAVGGMSGGGDFVERGARPPLQLPPGVQPTFPSRTMAGGGLGTFNPMTGTFNRGQPLDPMAGASARGQYAGSLPSQYQQLTPSYYQTRSETPEQRKLDAEYAQREAEKAETRALTQERLERLRPALQAAGVPDDKIDILAQDPKLLEAVMTKFLEKELGLGDLSGSDNIDPLSPAGIQARKDLAKYQAGLKPPPGAQEKVVPAAVVTAHRGNRQRLTVLDRAIAGITANPAAVGLKNVLPEKLIDRIPEWMSKGGKGGVPVRADISDLGSLIIHDRTGAAMSVAEFARQRGFTPLDTDSGYALLVKLRRLRQLIQEETDAMEESYSPATGYRDMLSPGKSRPSGGGSVPPGGTTGDIDLSDPDITDEDLREAQALIDAARRAERRP